MELSGLYVPLITPFTDAGQLDLAALAAQAAAVLDEGATGVVALGTTGESATLTREEQRRVAATCAGVCAERGKQMLLGAGSNDTAASTEMISEVDPQAAALLVVVPYYSRPSQDGVVEHFRRVAAASPVPVIVYNVPYRTSLSLTPDTLLRLAALPNVAGFKHAVGCIDDATIEFMRQVGPDVAVLAGDDAYAGPLMALGGRGAILASANILTRQYVELLQAWRQGPIDEARSLHNALAPVSRSLFAEPNPVVIKAVLAAQGRIPSRHVRLPLLPATDGALDAALGAIRPHEQRFRLGPHGVSASHAPRSNERRGRRTV
ncbi:4-hydroxy-tetrahydrodipicolinate synthase [Mycolicibacter engbaekii]|uniref:4-hydroxy-tetrahydrodipicolinate synthase n=1 Tax=Mycolicibacter engbaekii TaxID=188915 RepID=UPI000A1533F4|nr:4-hydroxy-tetrahydrodipicolinate synthase [Mycolicibacter engbaekii]